MTEAFYLFGLCYSDRKQILEIEGLEEGGDAPYVEAFNGIGAVITRLDATQFTGPGSEARLADPAWLLPRLHRHNAVLEWVRRRSPLLPLRFGTLFKTQDGLEQLIMRRHSDIRGYFDKVDDCEEWAVKLFCDHAFAASVSASHNLEIHAERLERLSPGKRYLEERRLRSEAERLLPTRLREEYADIATILQGCCNDWRERNLLKLDDNDDRGRMLRNWALLLSPSSVATLIPQLENYRDARYSSGLHLEWSGPWPPYSFCPPLDDG